MPGIEPHRVYFKQNERSSNTLTGEVAGDFMFWPTGSIVSAGISNRRTITALLPGTRSRLA